MTSQKTSRLLPLIGWIALTNAAGAVGAIASSHAGEFYGSLQRPSFAPPGSVFGPVWTLLYTLMGVAAWRVWRAAGDKRSAWILFAAQLIANAAWSWIFFWAHSGKWAFVEILLLWVLIAMTIRAFARIDRPAAWLLVPYLAWVSFATLLTWTIWRANPGVLG
jgi:tryptophan-rich sensory protein